MRIVHRDERLPKQKKWYRARFWPTNHEEVRSKQTQPSNLVGVASAAVATEGATEACEESEEEGNERTEDHPVGIAPGGIEAAIAHVAAGDAEEDHLDNPSNEGDEEGECADEGHEDGAGTVICGTAEAEEGRETSKTGAWGMAEYGTSGEALEWNVPMGIRTRTKVKLWKRSPFSLLSLEGR